MNTPAFCTSKLIINTDIYEIGIHYMESMLISSSHMPIWGRCIIMLVFIFLEYFWHRTQPQNQQQQKSSF